MTQTAVYRVDIVGRDAAGGVTTFRYATNGYCTSPSASPANTWVDGRLKQPLLMRRDMYGEGRTHGSVQITHGQTVLQNGDGGLDSLVNYGFDSQPFKLYRVDAVTLAETLVFVGYTEDANFSNEEVVFTVRDELYYLDRTLQPNKYAGTNALPNGVEGTSDNIQGRPKPIYGGYEKNIEPVLVNTSKLIYQFNDGGYTFGTPSTFIVYDMVSEIISRGTDYTSQADMEANAPDKFSYRVWPAGGMFRLGSTPAGKVTLELGQIVSWSSMLSGLIFPKALGGPSGAAFLLDTSRLSGISISNNVGIYYDNEINALDAAMEIVACINGTIQTYTHSSSPSTPVFTITRLEVPNAGASVLTLDRSNITDLQSVVPSDDERGIPPWRVRVNYAHNHTMMSPSEIAGSATQHNKDFATKEYRTVVQDNASLKLQYPNSPELQIVTHHLTNTDVTGTDVFGTSNQLPYLSNLYSGAKRRMFRAKIALELYEGVTSSTGTSGTVQGLVLGHNVVVTYPRFGLNAGVAMQVLGYSLDYQAQEAELILWGILP